jgi:prolipoprotein diacylglyceryltransferase
MVAPLFAMPPPYVLLFLPIGFLFVLLIAGLFLTATRARRKRGEQNRRAGLGLMAIICGPVVGASLAWVAITFGSVHPADVRYTYVVLTVIGGIAGFLGGIAFCITGLLVFRDSGKEAVAAKPVDVTDEL